MNPKKQKEKDRRRARKLVEEAWDAVNDGNLDLAEKIIRRATAAQQDNPVLWNDQGVILALRGKEAESADAFRAVISLAPTFAEPYARLAALRVRQGFTAEAVALQREAVRHAPDHAVYAEQLAAYRSLADSQNPRPVPVPTPPPPESGVAPPADPVGDWPRRLGEYDWERLDERLTRDGCVVLERLVDAASCEELCGMFDRDDLFAKTVAMDRPEFGQGTYRYFRSPIPAIVDQLRRAVYPHAARVANGWERLLGEPERFPPEWDAFREVCRGAGQSTPTPILLKYGPGGFNARTATCGSVYFPSDGRRAEPACRPGRTGVVGSGRRVPACRRAGAEEVAPPRVAARSGRRGAVLHARSSGEGRRGVRPAAGEARRGPHHGGHAVRTRRPVPRVPVIAPSRGKGTRGCVAFSPLHPTAAWHRTTSNLARLREPSARSTLPLLGRPNAARLPTPQVPARESPCHTNLPTTSPLRVRAGCPAEAHNLRPESSTLSARTPLSPLAACSGFPRNGRRQKHQGFRGLSAAAELKRPRSRAVNRRGRIEGRSF